MTSDLPSLYTAPEGYTRSDGRAIRNCRKRISRVHYGKFGMFKEYPDGVYISRVGKIVHTVRFKMPKEMSYVPKDQREGLNHYQLAQLKRMDRDLKVAAENADPLANQDYNPNDSANEEDEAEEFAVDSDQENEAIKDVLQEEEEEEDFEDDYISDSEVDDEVDDVDDDADDNIDEVHDEQQAEKADHHGMTEQPDETEPDEDEVSEVEEEV